MFNYCRVFVELYNIYNILFYLHFYELLSLCKVNIDVAKSTTFFSLPVLVIPNYAEVDNNIHAVRAPYNKIMIHCKI